MTVIDQFPRRAFLKGLVAIGASGLVATPAIVRASSLDLPPVRHLLEAGVEDVKLAIKEPSLPEWAIWRASKIEEYRTSPTKFAQQYLQEWKGPIFDGTAYNQKTGLWESGLTRDLLASRPELLTDSMPKSEWMKRRKHHVINGTNPGSPNYRADLERKFRFHS